MKISGSYCFRGFFYFSVGRGSGRGNKKRNFTLNEVPFLFRIEKFNLAVGSFFFDSGFLTGKSTQIVQFSATNFTYLVHFDAVDSR